MTHFWRLVLGFLLILIAFNAVAARGIRDRGERFALLIILDILLGTGLVILIEALK